MLGFVHGIPRTNRGRALPALAPPRRPARRAGARPRREAQALPAGVVPRARDPARDLDVRPVPAEEREAEHRAAARDGAEPPAGLLRPHRRHLRRPADGPVRGGLASRRSARRARGAGRGAASRRHGRRAGGDAAGGDSRRKASPPSRSSRTRPASIAPIRSGASPRAGSSEGWRWPCSRRATRSRTSTARDGDARVRPRPDRVIEFSNRRTTMKKILRVLVPAAFLLLAPVFAQAAVDDFQVTGNVTEKTADSITVMKGKERFQIAIDKDTKMTGDVEGRRQGHDQVQDARELDRGEGSGRGQGSQTRKEEVGDVDSSLSSLSLPSKKYFFLLLRPSPALPSVSPPGSARRAGRSARRGVRPERRRADVT